MATFDDHKNFAYSTVATPPSPPASGTSLTVAAGEGANFPTVPFNAVIWPVNLLPLVGNAEVVRVTAIATDTLTITRAQEGSSARTVLAGDQIAAAVTDKALTDIETALNAHGAAEHTNRTRIMHIDINGFAAIFGVPDLAQRGSDAGVANKTFGWAFDGAVSETIQYRGLIVLPADITATSTIIVRLHWAASTAAGGNVYWRVEYAFISANEQIDEATTAINVQVGTAGVADREEVINLETAAKVAGDVLFKLNIARIGDDVLDTYNAADAWLVAVELQYTADS